MHLRLQQEKKYAGIKSVCIFVMHQLIGTFGAATIAAFLVNFSFKLLHPLDASLFTSHNASVLLTELPYFPAQIILAAWLGFWLALRVQHRVMLWVWVLPLLVLCYAVIVGPIFTPESTSVLMLSGSSPATFSHYFGSGCNPEKLCEDQLMITMPFYAASSYSVGALLGKKLNHLQRHGLIG